MRIVFMGTPEAAVASLERLVADGHEVIEVWTQPDRPSGRGKKMTPPPVKISAEKLGIPVFQPEKIRSKETRQKFRNLKADVAVVVAYGRILTKTYLESFQMGAINVHFSLLPKYRGAAPVNWAIAHGETRTGVTTMQMDAGLDTGDILISKSVEIGERENAVELMERLSYLGAEAISETLASYDSITPSRQDERNATLAPLMSKADGLVDWTLAAREIANRIRAFQPFPKSFSFLEGKRITFWEAEAVDFRDQIASAPACDGPIEPGRVVLASESDLVIGCGSDTTLRILELQMEGRPRLKVSEFLNGAEIGEESCFENE